MTNTRITDPEILEKRYPVFLTTFTLRENSGGNGKYCGGNGVVRELQFRSPVTLSILTERRSFAPNGIESKINIVHLTNFNLVILFKYNVLIKYLNYFIKKNMLCIQVIYSVIN